jgi:signal recognition particle receptor subunit beta
MKTVKIALMATMSALMLSFLTMGCDRTLSHTESEKVKSDGTVEKKEKTVSESPDGTIKKEEKKSTDRP